MATGLFSSLYSQVDPLHIGEAARSMSIASQYGGRLIKNGGNIDIEALKFITSMYPSHGFVIDYDEAKLLFGRVRKPNKEEIILMEALGDDAVWPFDDMKAQIEFLSSELPISQEQESEDKQGDKDESESKVTSRGGRGRVDRTPRKNNGRANNKRAVTELDRSSKNNDREPRSV